MEVRNTASIFIGAADGKVTNVAFSSNPEESGYIKFTGMDEDIVILTLGEGSLVFAWMEIGYTLGTKTDVTGRAANAAALIAGALPEQP